MLCSARTVRAVSVVRIGEKSDSWLVRQFIDNVKFYCRFVKSFSADSSNAKSGLLIGGSSLLSASIMDGLQSNEQNNTANLLPEMDIFSAGYGHQFHLT